MKYDEAIKIREKLTHIIGTGYEDIQIDDILIMPNDPDLFKEATEAFLRNFKWETVAGSYSFANDHIIIFVLNKKMIISDGIFLYRILDSALEKFGIELEELTNGGTFQP